MRYALLGAATVTLLAAPELARAQMPTSDAVRLVSDMRWIGGNCPALKVDYQATQRFMDRSGLINAFNPDGPLRDYLKKHDKELDGALNSVGTEVICQSFLDKYRLTGLILVRSQADIDELNDMRRSNGGAPVAPLK